MDLQRDRFKYRVNIQLRRYRQPAFENNKVEFRSEEYGSDEELCLAVVSELINQLIADRDYLEGKEDDAPSDR